MRTRGRERERERQTRNEVGSEIKWSGLAEAAREEGTAWKRWNEQNEDGDLETERGIGRKLRNTTETKRQTESVTEEWGGGERRE